MQNNKTTKRIFLIQLIWFLAPIDIQLVLNCLRQIENHTPTTNCEEIVSRDQQIGRNCY